MKVSETSGNPTILVFSERLQIANDVERRNIKFQDNDPTVTTIPIQTVNGERNLALVPAVINMGTAEAPNWTEADVTLNRTILRLVEAGELSAKEYGVILKKVPAKVDEETGKTVRNEYVATNVVRGTFQ